MALHQAKLWDYRFTASIGLCHMVIDVRGTEAKKSNAVQHSAAYLESERCLVNRTSRDMYSTSIFNK